MRLKAAPMLWTALSEVAPNVARSGPSSEVPQAAHPLLSMPSVAAIPLVPVARAEAVLRRSAYTRTAMFMPNKKANEMTLKERKLSNEVKSAS